LFSHNEKDGKAMKENFGTMFPSLPKAGLKNLPE
jgi:hypothetical protein